MILWLCLVLAHSITLVTCNTPVNTVKPGNTLDVSDYLAREFLVCIIHARPFFPAMIQEPLVKPGASRL